MDLISTNQTRAQFVESTIGVNREFGHGRSTLYYSPRLVTSDFIAGVIEKKATETIKSGPWKNEQHKIETFHTTNFAIRLNGGQEVSVQQNPDVFTGDAIALFESLAKSINDGTHAWYVNFRRVGSKHDLDDYIRKNTGSIKRISIIFEMPNSDYGHLQNIHDDLRESLLRAKADKLKKEYHSSKGELTPDQAVLDEMHLANEGTGSLQIANSDDTGNISSFNSESTEFSSIIDDNRRIDELEDADDIRSVAEAMLNGAKNNE